MSEWLEDLVRVVDTLDGFVYRRKNDRGWTVTHLSRGVEAVCGHPAEELLSGARSWGGLIHAADADELWTHVQKALAAREDFAVSYRITARDGDVRWVFERGRGVFDAGGQLLHLVGHVMNDTVRMRALAELHAKDAERSSLAGELAHERDLAQSVIATAPVIILLLDERGAIQHVNPYFEELVGYRLDELRGKDWFSTFLPERDRERIRALFASAKGGTRVRANANPIVTRSGEEREIEWYDQLMHDAQGKLEFVLAIGQDVTERRRSLEAQQASQQELRDVLDSMFAFVALLTVDGDILDANRAPIELAGLTREAVIGRKLWEMPFFTGAPEATAAVMDALRRAAAGETVRRDVPLQIAADIRMIADAAFGPVRDASGRVVRVVASGVDVTEQREAEQKRLMLEAQLRQAQKLDALGTLAGGIAHDFNNVLTAILGNVELARIRRDRGLDLGDAIDEIAKAGKRARDLVQRILTFSSRQEQSLARTRLALVIEEALQLLRPTLPARVEVQLRPGGEQLMALADASQVHQVIMNLVTNAWHALADRPGRVEISLAPEQVDGQRLALQAELAKGRYVRVDVRDDGAGMDAATLDRVFEPFFTTKPQGQGTGLGLSVVHGIMRAHGGTVLVESELGKGTTVHLYFPAADDRAVSEQPPERAERVTGAGEHILFVDDEPALVDIARALLQSVGYRVTCHTNAEQALATFLQDPQRFDLLITDYSMTGMTGAELARQVLAIQPRMPVIVTSGYLTQAQLEAARHLGVAEVLMKPVSFDRLSAVIAEQLARRRPGEVESAGRGEEAPQ